MVKVFALMLCMLLIFSFAGCGKTEEPAAVDAEPVNPLDDPISLTYFSFYHNGSSTEEIYSYTAEKTEQGTHLCIELNAGNTLVDVVVEEDVLGELGEIAAQHRLDLWNGFDRVNSNVMDGSGFSLYMTTEAGENVTAHGSNAFPKGYGEAETAINALFDRLVEDYGNLYPKTLESDDMESFFLTLREGNSKVLSVSAYRKAEKSISLDLHLKGYDDLFSEEYFFYGTSDTFPFEEIQSVVRKYDIPAWNGWDRVDSENSSDGWFQLELRYSSGEQISAIGSSQPQGFDGAMEELSGILCEYISKNGGNFVPN